MKKITLIILIFIGLVLSSCKKDEKGTEIKIEYEFLDDVTPVKTILSVNEDIGWSEWIINDTSFYYPNSENFIEHVFRKEGVSNIKLNASKGGEKYVGNLELEIPPFADKLIIYGYYFEQDYEFNINEDTLNFEFRCFNTSVYMESNRLISKIDFENNDSILFEAPIIFDIDGFEHGVDEGLYLGFFSIDKEGVESYFETGYFINTYYFNQRLSSPNIIKLINSGAGPIEEICLIIDWTT